MNYNEIKEELKKSQDNIKNFNYEKKEEEYYFEFKEKFRKFRKISNKWEEKTEENRCESRLNCKRAKK